MFRPLLSLLATLAIAVLAGCGGGSIGNACTTNDDCDSGQTCLTQFPGGFCGRGCDQAGATRECPSDSLCANLTPTTLSCSPTCESDGDCRDEYRCAPVPGTGVSVCVP